LDLTFAWDPSRQTASECQIRCTSRAPQAASAVADEVSGKNRMAQSAVAPSHPPISKNG